MACYIHTFVSTRYDGCDKWTPINMYTRGEFDLPIRVEPYNGCDYTMFGVLADTCRCTETGKFVCHQWGIDCSTPQSVIEEIDIRNIENKDGVNDIGHVTLDEIKAAYHNKADFSKDERKSLKPLIRGIEFMRDAAYRDVLDSNVRLDFFFER